MSKKPLDLLVTELRIGEFYETIHAFALNGVSVQLQIVSKDHAAQVRVRQYGPGRIMFTVKKRRAV